MTTYSTARRTLSTYALLARAAIVNASTLKSNHIRGLRNILAERQGGLCAGCGQSLTGVRMELCHIVSAAYGKGIIPANVYVGCKECNDYDREVSNGDAAAIIASMVRPDLVELFHPDRPTCLAASGNDRAASVRAARDAARG